MSEENIENITKSDSYFAWEHGKNVIIFEADMNPFVHIDNKNKNISFLGERPT